MPTDKDLAAAAARIEAIAPAKGAEGRLNAISDKATAADSKVQQGRALVDGLERYKDSNPSLVAAAMEGLGKIGASDVVAKSMAIEQQLSKFAERSQIVMKGLDLTAQAHPFIGLAVGVLKGAIQLEITRRNNDKKVLALKDKMMDMLDVLRSLNDVKDMECAGPDGVTVENRLQRSLDEAVIDIHDCSAACEEYLRKKFIMRLLDGSRWEGRLASYGDRFDQKKDDFVFALNIHIAHGVDKLQNSIGANTTQLSTLLLFVQLQSSEERDIIKIIGEMGGPEACISDEKVFAELQAKMKMVTRSRNSAAEATARIAIGEIREGMREDIDVALAKERETFDRKFCLMQKTMAEMKTVVTRNSDRNTELILATMNSGPHERIFDKDLHAVWKLMAWRGSVEAHQFIIAIQDHFVQKYGGKGNTISSYEGDTPAPPDPAEDSARDEWAITYITLTRVRPIREAFDDDASGWISIKEANTLTSTRPLNYSVTKWLAFWAAGFRVVCEDYAHKIDSLRVRMIRSARDVQPCNRLRVNKYLSKWHMDVIDYLTRGVLTKDNYDCYEDDDEIWRHFRDFVKNEEERLQCGLDLYGVIDDSTTLALILGPGRLERNIFPLLYLVLMRHYDLLRLAAHFRIDDREFDVAEESLATIREALDDRLHTLISNFRNQNLDPKQQLSHAYNRMASYSVYYDWTLKENVNAHEYQNTAHAVVPVQAPDTSILRWAYGPPPIPDHFYDINSYDSESFIVEDAGPSPSSSVVGKWVGEHYRCCSADIIRTSHFCMLAIRFNVSDGKVTGEGRDCVGEFTVIGTANLIAPSDATAVRLHIEFDTTPASLSDFGSLSPVHRYVGDVQTVRGLFTEMRGKSFEKTRRDCSDTYEEKGDFVLARSTAVNNCHSPLAAVMDAKTRWVMLIETVLEQVRRRRCNSKWEYYRRRRDDRIRVVEANQRLLVAQEPKLFLRTYPPGTSRGWSDVQREIESRLAVEDIAFYRWLAQHRLRSETIHIGIACDGCEVVPVGPRFICLDCKPANPDHRIDLCSKCADVTLSLPAPHSLEHVASHDKVKTLRLLTRRELLRTLRVGRSRLAIARQRLEHKRDSSVESEIQSCCRVCKSTVGQPCWACIDCTGDAFLCDKCELEQLVMSVKDHERGGKEDWTMDWENGEDSSSSSDFETDPDAGEGESSAHFWWHVIVRVRSPPIAPSKLELDARLSILEEKFTAAQSSLSLLDKKSNDAQSKLDNLVDLVVALGDKVETSLDGRLEKLENAARVQQGLFDSQTAGVEALLRQVLAKLG